SSRSPCRGASQVVQRYCVRSWQSRLGWIGPFRGSPCAALPIRREHDLSLSHRRPESSLPVMSVNIGHFTLSNQACGAPDIRLDVISKCLLLADTVEKVVSDPPNATIESEQQAI